MKVIPPDTNIAYHATRLLIVVAICGIPRGKKATTLPGIEGRTLLAKLDFFLRYPSYLKKAASIMGKTISDKELGLSSTEELHSVESQMIRYLYGPWDHIYYPVLAYLIGKQLIEVQKKAGTEIFRLTNKGKTIVEQITNEDAYSDLVSRAEVIYHLFNKFTGTGLKDFIYANFPEVVGRNIGATI